MSATDHSKWNIPTIPLQRLTVCCSCLYCLDHLSKLYPELNFFSVSISTLLFVPRLGLCWKCWQSKNRDNAHQQREYSLYRKTPLKQLIPKSPVFIFSRVKDASDDHTEVIGLAMQNSDSLNDKSFNAKKYFSYRQASQMIPHIGPLVAEDLAWEAMAASLRYSMLQRYNSIGILKNQHLNSLNGDGNSAVIKHTKLIVLAK